MKKDKDHGKLGRNLWANRCEKTEEEIDLHIEKDPLLKWILSKLQGLWRSKQSSIQAWDVDAGWAKVNLKIEKEAEKQTQSPESQHKNDKKSQEELLKYRQSPKRWFLRVAAVFLVTGILSLAGLHYFGDYHQPESAAILEVVTDRGERGEIKLENGSFARLGPDSRIRYSREFEDDGRSVHLSGEAYFEVASDDRPFYVYADQLVVQVVGTAFNVKAYEEEEEIQVVVVSGKVDVSSDVSYGDTSVVLDKGDMASYQRVDRAFTVAHNVNLDHHLGWLENRLTFNDVPLEEVAKKLERWYGMEVTLSEPELAELRFSGSFEDEPVNEVLRILQLALELEYEIRERQVTFYRNAAKEDSQ